MTRFYSCHKTDKNFKSLYGFGRRFLKITDVCMDFGPYFKVHNLVSVNPKNIILCKMTNLNMIFHVVGPVYRLVKIWNSPQFPDEFRKGQFARLCHPSFKATRSLPSSRYSEVIVDVYPVMFCRTRVRGRGQRTWPVSVRKMQANVHQPAEIPETQGS